MGHSVGRVSRVNYRGGACPVKAKKTLFLTVLTLTLVVGLVAAGTAVAAPAHHPTHVAGTIERPPLSQTYGTPYLKGDMVIRPDNVITYAWHGVLEGTFVEYFTVRAPLSDDGLNGKGPYTLAGRCTFDGTFNGRETHWVGHLKGEGYIDPAFVFRGWETSVVTITSSTGPLAHLRGHIVARGSFDALDPSYGSATYSGRLIW
jgi:hypothetical protein